MASGLKRGSGTIATDGSEASEPWEGCGCLSSSICFTKGISKSPSQTICDPMEHSFKMADRDIQSRRCSNEGDPLSTSHALSDVLGFENMALYGRAKARCGVVLLN